MTKATIDLRVHDLEARVAELTRLLVGLQLARVNRRGSMRLGRTVTVSDDYPNEPADTYAIVFLDGEFEQEAGNQNASLTERSASNQAFAHDLFQQYLPVGTEVFVAEIDGRWWILRSGDNDATNASGYEGEDACCAGIETAKPDENGCCPPGFIRISLKKLADALRYEDAGCDCDGVSGSGGVSASANCDPEPSWASDPCDYTCLSIDSANIVNSCGDPECPCTDDPIDAASQDGITMTKFPANELLNHPEDNPELISTYGDVFYLTTGSGVSKKQWWVWKQKSGSRYEFHSRYQEAENESTLEIASCVETGGGESSGGSGGGEASDPDNDGVLNEGDILDGGSL